MTRDDAGGRSLGLTTVVSYGTGSIITGIFATVPTMLLLYFCTQILGIPALWAAVIVVLPKIWTLVFDPWIGALSDRTAHRAGRRRPFLAVGSIGIGASFIAVFSPPAMSPPATIAWMIVAYFALTTFYSIFAVPFMAVPAQIGRNSDERRRLTAWRMSFVMIGILGGASAAPMLVATAGSARTGYQFMALVLVLISVPAMIAPILALRGIDTPLPIRSSTSVPPVGLLLAPWKDGSFRRLSIGYLLLISAVGAISAAIPYLVTQSLGRAEADTGIALGLVVLGAFVATPLWAMFGRRRGDRRMLRAAAAVYGVGALLLASTTAGMLPVFVALVALGICGIGFGGIQLLAFTIAAHHIRQVADADCGEALFTGAWASAEKLGLAAGPALTAVCLAAVSPDQPMFSVLLVVSVVILIALGGRVTTEAS